MKTDEVGIELKLLPSNGAPNQNASAAIVAGRAYCCRADCCSRRTKAISSLFGLTMGMFVTLMSAYLIPHYSGFPGWQKAAFVGLIGGLALTILGTGCYQRHARPRCQDMREYTRECYRQSC